MKYVSQSDIPFTEAFYMVDRFVILNMWTQGVWYVDMQHPEWEKIKETALAIARTFGDHDQIKKLQELPKIEA
ncbi:MAG: hypothetical protein ACTHMM_05475 [Agriterribacter sp.]